MATQNLNKDLILETMRQNEYSALFLHPQSGDWVVQDASLSSARKSFLHNLRDPQQARDYYRGAIRKAKNYEETCRAIKEFNLASYCLSLKLSLPNITEQFYARNDKEMFEKYQKNRLKWHRDCIRDNWGIEILPEVLSLDKSIQDLFDGNSEQGDASEQEAYYDIQYMILKASFGLGNYELAFDKMSILADKSTPEEMQMLMDCLLLLKGEQCSYVIQDLYDTFNFSELEKVLYAQQNNGPVYIMGVVCFLKIIRRKMYITLLNITKRVSLDRIASQFNLSLEDATKEISWLIIVLELPFMISEGEIVYQTANENQKIKTHINDILDSSIIHSEATKTASLINMSFT